MTRAEYREVQRIRREVLAAFNECCKLINQVSRKAVKQKRQRAKLYRRYVDAISTYLRRNYNHFIDDETLTKICEGLNRKAAIVDMEAEEYAYQEWRHRKSFQIAGRCKILGHGCITTGEFEDFA